MEYINIGTSPNSGDADSLIVAIGKINRNFQSISKELKIIVWNGLEDTRQAMEDINNNFKQIETWNLKEKSK